MVLQTCARAHFVLEEGERQNESGMTDGRYRASAGIHVRSRSVAEQILARVPNPECKK